jgi:xanthine dehydrogenase YagS FAD-binding subunit
MKPFRYARATDVQMAVATVAATSGAAYLGGGTSLVDQMKLSLQAPTLLLDVTGLPLAGIDRTRAGGLRIGAEVRNSDLAADSRVRADYPLVAHAILAGASGQVRNMATVAGNLLQHPRCVYFTDITKPCNRRRPGSGCPALAAGERDLAVLGGTDQCAATHPSDLAVALTALAPVLHLSGPGGERSIRLADLYRSPGGRRYPGSTLDRADLITAVELPAPALARRSVYRKVRDRASFAFGLVSVAAALDVVDGTVRDVRLALGAVAPVPWRARRAEETLRGQPATERAFRQAAELELAAATPPPGAAFKVRLVRDVLVRALSELAAAGSAPGRHSR